MEHTDTTNLTIIGRAERIDLPNLGLAGVPAKIDTGADLSSIWGSKVSETSEGGLMCTLFAPGNEFYTGEKLHFPSGEYEVTRVANSFGDKEFRYKIKLTIRVKGRRVKGSFTLADRSAKTYPVLLGRSLLKGKFVVDVKAGDPLLKEEREQKARLREELRKIGE